MKSCYIVCGQQKSQQICCLTKSQCVRLIPISQCVKKVEVNYSQKPSLPSQDVRTSRNHEEAHHWDRLEHARDPHEDGRSTINRITRFLVN